MALEPPVSQQGGRVEAQILLALLDHGHLACSLHSGAYELTVLPLLLHVQKKMLARWSKLRINISPEIYLLSANKLLICLRQI